MYVSVSDVRQVAPYVPISRDSNPSEGTIATWVDDEETILNSTLAKMGYTTPITGPKSLVVVRKIVSHIVMARIMRARPNPESDPKEFQNTADALMKRLTDPEDPFDLEDAVKDPGVAVLKSSTIRVSSNLTDLLDEDPMRIHRNQIF